MKRTVPSLRPGFEAPLADVGDAISFIRTSWGLVGVCGPLPLVVFVAVVVFVVLPLRLRLAIDFRFPIV